LDRVESRLEWKNQRINRKSTLRGHNYIVYVIFTQFKLLSQLFSIFSVHIVLTFATFGPLLKLLSVDCGSLFDRNSFSRCGYTKDKSLTSGE
jgi:hypothetical protein